MYQSQVATHARVDAFLLHVSAMVLPNEILGFNTEQHTPLTLPKPLTSTSLYGIVAHTTAVEDGSALGKFTV